MKDAYSFDRDEEGLDAAFRAHAGAYKRIFERCGLDAVAVQAESGMMGGSESIDFLAPAGSGENTLVTCERGRLRGRSRDRARRPAPAVVPGARWTRRRRSRRPGSRPARTSPTSSGSTSPRRRRRCPSSANGKVVLALVRGDDRLDEAKLAAALGSDVRPAAGRRDQRGVRGRARLARARRVRRRRIVLDDALREGQFVAGANRTGYHLRGVEHGRDFDARARRHPPRARRRHVPALRRGAALPDGDRGRPHLQARDGLLGPARRDVPRRAVGRAPGRDGELRDRPGPRAGGDRRAAPRRAGHRLAAPGRAVRRRMCSRSPPAPTRSRRSPLGLAEELGATGRDVLLDDRDARPGEKFADADLLGCPLRVTVGKKSLDDGSVDVRRRTETDDTRVPRASVIDWTTED